jgi:hypothetical protein
MLLHVGLLAAPLAADGQQPGKMWRIGYLGTFPMDPQSEIGSAVALGLREHGYVEGQNLHIERRPGGNVIGLTSIEWEAFTAKQLEVLKDAAPRAGGGR